MSSLDSIRDRFFLKLSFVIISIFLFISIFADFIASSKPLLLYWKGKLYLFPNLINYNELRLYDNFYISSHLGKDDWAILPPVPFGPYQCKTWNVVLPLLPPSSLHLLGTDNSGRDVLARIIHGSRVSMMVGIISTFLYCFLGVVIGAISGYRGGRFDKITRKLTETVLSIPTFLLILAIQGLLSKTSIIQLVLIITITRWTEVASLIRNEVIKIKKLPFVEASIAIGVSDRKILWEHIIPNVIYPVYVAFAFGVSGTIIIESSLSFLGFGVPPPIPTWGELLSQSYIYREAWWMSIPSGLIIFILLCAFNLIGEFLQKRYLYRELRTI